MFRPKRGSEEGQLIDLSRSARVCREDPSLTIRGICRGCMENGSEEMKAVPAKTDGNRRFGAVIPAAGMSSRMKTFKPLLPFRDSTVIECTAEVVLGAVPRAVVVLGNHADEVERALKKRFDERLMIVRNPDYRTTDMLRSVQIGLDALGNCDGFFLLPGDMPAVGNDTFEALMRAFDDEHMVFFPTYDGRKGHPPLIHASMIPAIRSYRADGGLRAVFREVPQRLIELSDKGITADLDTPKDYADMIHQTLHDQGMR